VGNGEDDVRLFLLKDVRLFLLKVGHNPSSNDHLHVFSMSCRWYAPVGLLRDVSGLYAEGIMRKSDSDVDFNVHYEVSFNSAIYTESARQ
jgi:hypothetical protein